MDTAINGTISGQNSITNPVLNCSALSPNSSFRMPKALSLVQ